MILALSGQVSLGHAASWAWAPTPVPCWWRTGLHPAAGLIRAWRVGRGGLAVSGATSSLRGHFLALTTLAWGTRWPVLPRGSRLTGGASGLAGIAPLHAVRPVAERARPWPC